jgi:hypothetical protein
MPAWHKPSNRSPKNAGTIHFMFGGRFGVSLTGADNGLRSIFLADFFIKKAHQQIGRKDSIQAVCKRMRRVDGILYAAEKKL